MEVEMIIDTFSWFYETNKNIHKQRAERIC